MSAIRVQVDVCRVLSSEHDLNKTLQRLAEAMRANAPFVVDVHGCPRLNVVYV